MKSFFMRQFLLTAVLLLMSFVIMGTLFIVLMFDYVVDEKRETMASNADTVARLALAYMMEGNLRESWDFRMNITSTADATGVNILIADTSGEILSCSDEDIRCWHMGHVLDSTVCSRVLSTGNCVTMGTLNGVYPTSHYIVGKAITNELSGQVMGMVVFASDMSATEELASTVGTIFFLIALTVLLFALLSIGYTSRHFTAPLKEMAVAAKKFAHGEYGVRVKVRNRRDEVGELIVSFNAMAEAIEQSETRRREFVANVSHELKTPMTTIAGFIDGILDGTIPYEEQERYLETVTEEVHRLSRLVQRMLEVSRLQEKALNKERFDIRETLLRVLLSFEQKINDKQLSVYTQLGDDPVFVCGEVDQIVQVIYNLIDNGIKFADFEGYLGVGLITQGQKAYISIQNTGPTIPKEQLNLIFDRFHKIDGSRNRAREGVGLGLHIVKMILNSHGEDIRVQSEDGITRFVFTLSLKKEK